MNKWIKISNPKIIDKLLQQAIFLHKEGKLKDAERVYYSLLKKQENHGAANHNLGILKVKLNKLDDAIHLFKKSVQVNPYEEQYWISYVNTLLKIKHFKEAEKVCLKAISLIPGSGSIYNNLGIACLHLNKLNRAEVYYKKAIELKENYFIGYYNFANLLTDIGRYNEAVKNYIIAIKIKPDFIEAISNLGNTQIDLGDLENAEKNYDKIIKIKPDFSDALLNKGKILFKKAEYELSLKSFDLSNSKESKAKSLSCLYALGRIDEIYERIEKYSKIDNKNISIAAFSSFISKKEKRNTAYKFCENPLDFIYVSNFTPIFKNPKIFINKVVKELNNINTIWEPSGRTTKNGFHSGNKFNIFNNTSTNLNKLKSIIMNEIDSYYSKFFNETCALIQDWPSNKEIFGWYVILKKQGYQVSHYHPGGWLSGVVYLKVVPSLKRNEGAIEFSLNGEDYFDPNSPKKIHKPKSGDIVLFPSSLNHSTIPFTTYSDRVIVAFDLNPSKKIVNIKN